MYNRQSIVHSRIHSSVPVQSPIQWQHPRNQTWRHHLVDPSGWEGGREGEGRGERGEGRRERGEGRGEEGEGRGERGGGRGERGGGRGERGGGRGERGERGGGLAPLAGREEERERGEGRGEEGERSKYCTVILSLSSNQPLPP